MDLALKFEVIELHAAYAACLDDGRFEEWPDFFTQSCVYQLVARENHDRGRPLATLSFESKGMIKDRVFSITQSLFHAPYYQRHLVGMPRSIVEIAGGLHAQTNYLVIRTRQNEPSDIFNAGRYIDTMVREEGCLKFSRRICVFDSELIANSIVYPI